MTPQAYNRHHIALMTEYVRGTTASRPINDEYMGIDGELYFKCESCKCWCIVESEEHKNGSKVCNFCSKLHVDKPV